MAGETVTVIRPSAADAFGDRSGSTEFTVDGCLFAPGPSAEMGVGSAGTDTDATIYAPAGVDVRSTDRIRARDRTYTVVGVPQDWGSAGVVIVLRQAA